MTKTVENNRRLVGKNVRLYYGIALSIMTAVCGALFITAVWNVYVTGNAAGYDGIYAFTRERLADSLKTFALIPFVIWAAMILVGWVLWEVFPPESKRYKNDVRYNLYRQKKRMPEKVEGELKCSYDVVKREEKIVKILWLFAGIICLAAAVYTVVYLCLPSSFPSVENKSVPVLNMVKNVMPFVFAAFIVCLVVAVFEGLSAKKQLKEVQKLTVGEKVKLKPTVWEKWRNAVAEKADKKLCRGVVKFMDFTGRHYVAIIRVAVACVCVTFVIAGAFNGGMQQMLAKAINICTECIGLG